MVNTVTIKDGLEPTAGSATTSESTTVSPQSQERPSWLPEKFQSAEDLAKAYGELEKQFSSSKQEQPQPSEEQPTQQQLEQQTGLDLNPYYEEYSKDGKLGEESYEKLAASGLNKDLVDSFIAGQEALANNHVNSIQQAAGGADKYAEIVQWAGNNLSEGEVNNFNEIVEKGSLEAATFAVKGLKAQYDAQFGSQPDLLQGQNAKVDNDVYRSTAEVVRAINDPKYHKDTAYRKSVEEKIKRSNVM